MSKRGPGANFGGDEDRYGHSGGSNMNEEEKPMKATAAQMAKRKIAAGRKPAGAGARSRGQSPAFPPSNPAPSQGSGLFGNFQQQSMSFAPQNSQFTFGTASPSPAPSFGGFGQSTPGPATEQQNGTGSIFGGGQSVGPSFNSAFSAAPTPPPQQNGFGGGFGTQSLQPSQQTNNSSFSGFGATQQNGATPTTATFPSFNKPQESAQNGASSMFNTGGTQQEAPKPSNPFASFQFNTPKQDDHPKLSTPSFGGFGAASQPQEVQNKSNGSISFGQKSQEGSDKPAGSGFAGFGQKSQENGMQPSTSIPGFGQNHLETSKPSNLFTGFGQTAANEKSLFSMPNANGDKEKSAGPQTPSLGLFGQGQQNGERPAETQGGKPALFSSFGQSQSATAQVEQSASKSNTTGLFGASAATSQAEPPASKPSTSGLFGASTLSQAPQVNGEPKGLFGASTAPFATAKSGGSVLDNAPKNSSNLKTYHFSSADPSQVYDAANDEDEVPRPSAATPFGPSSQNIFGAAQTQPSSSLLKPSASQQDTSMTTPGNTPQKSLFAPSNQQQGTSSATPTAPRSLFERMEKPAATPTQQSGTASETPATAKPLFAPSASSATPSLFQPAQPSQAVEDTPKPRSMFDQLDSAAPSQPADNTPKPRSLFERIEKPTVQKPSTPAPPSAPTHTSNVPATAPPARTLPPPQTQPSASTAAVSAVSIEQAAKFRQLNEALLDHLKSQDSRKDWTTTFDYYAAAAAGIRGIQTPAPKAGSSTAHKTVQSSSSTPHLASAPAPVAGNNIFAQASRSAAPTNTLGAETPQPQGGSSLFSKPPSTAPPAAKKRPYEDDGSAQPPATEKRSKLNESANYSSLSANASSTSKLFASALDSSKTADSSKAASSSGFNPSKSLFASPTAQTATPSKPATGFTPSFGAPTSSGGSFLSAFGSKAKAAEDDAKKKRMDDDYDSEEETKEQWEKRDQQKQEAKRKEIEAAAKAGTGFMFGGTSANKAADATAGEKAQGAGNNTWKLETPIKFGASTAGLASTTPAVPPPTFGGGLFGAASTPAAFATEAGKLAPPSTGFSFGPKASSLNASRATTPGVTTDGEASNAGEAKEDGEEQNEPQADDMTALLPEERQANEILLELPHIVTKTFEKVAEDSEKPSWIGKGEGKAYILKEKSSGKTRILQKVGVNQLALNFNPVKGVKYELHPKKDTMVIGTFFDHIHSKPAKLVRFFLTTDSADEAKDLARVLTEGTPK